MKKLIFVVSIVLGLVLVSVTVALAATSSTAPAATPAPVTPSASAPAAVNLALNKPITESSHIQYFVVKNANDGNVNSYWEGEVKTYPNLVTVDLGAASNITSVTVKLNPRMVWEMRTQTIEVLGSVDGVTFTQLVASTVYTFDPETNKNTVSIPVTANTRYLRLTFTANTGATAGQVAELEVY